MRFMLLVVVTMVIVMMRIRPQGILGADTVFRQ